jgi:hypothetical protein
MCACSPECPARAVRWPERFRGGCSFGASDWRAEDSPARGDQTQRRYQRRTALPRHDVRSSRTVPSPKSSAVMSGSGLAAQLGARTSPWRPASRALHAQLGAGTTLSAGGELIIGSRGGQIRLSPLGRQLSKAALDLGDDPAHGDAENALAALDQIDDLIR